MFPKTTVYHHSRHWSVFHKIKKTLQQYMSPFEVRQTATNPHAWDWPKVVILLRKSSISWVLAAWGGQASYIGGEGRSWRGSRATWPDQRPRWTSSFASRGATIPGLSPKAELKVHVLVLRTQLEDYALPPQDGRWDKHPKAEEELDISNSSSADLDLDLDIDLDQSRESLFDFDPPASNLRFENQTIDEGRRSWM